MKPLQLKLSVTCNTSINTTREVWELCPLCTRCGFPITESDVMQRDPKTPFRVIHYQCPLYRVQS